MRDNFPEYYFPTEDDYRALWTEGLVILDTNVLLSLYRTPTVARDEFLALLGRIGDRLWIPHQVALEFQRNRVNVIATEKKLTEDTLTQASLVIKDLSTKVDTLQVEKRGLGIDTSSIMKELKQANDKLIEAIAIVHKAQIDISSTDVVRDALDKLYMGRTGPGPRDQAALDEMLMDAEDRYLRRVPPGYLDHSKDRNPNDATFTYRSINYQKKFGDLILWKQILQHARDANISNLMLITSDNKDDWWRRENGHTMGPHPELTLEVLSSTPVKRFWMYSSSQFAENSNRYVGALVSQQSVTQLAEAHDQAAELTQASRNEIAHALSKLSFSTKDPDADRQALFAVMRWLSRNGRIINLSSRSRLTVAGDDGPDVYEVRVVNNSRLLINVIKNSIRYPHSSADISFTSFNLIIVVDEIDYDIVLDELRSIRYNMPRLFVVDKVSIILGKIDDDIFVPVFRVDAFGEVSFF